jgi:group I intron endonuclease
MFCIIYKITNLLNDMCYVGQTWQPLQKRFLQHKNKNDSPKLFNAIEKYGFNNFKIEFIMAVTSQIMADFYETYFIEKFNSKKREIGYNIDNGGKGVGKCSEETKLKISKTLTGRKPTPFTEQHKTNMSIAKIGHSVSIETRNKISVAHTGKILTKEHSEKIAASHKGLIYVIKNPEQRNMNISNGKKKKITDAQVLEIIDKWNNKEYSGPELAEMYNTTRKYIYAIVSGKKRKLASKK